MNEFSLRILEVDGEFYNGQCVSIVVPTTEGSYGIQANHVNLFSALKTGTIKYTLPDGKVCYAAVSGGMIKVEDNEVLILADSVESPDEIDVKRATQEQIDAQSILNEAGDYRSKITAEAMMQRAINRLKIKKRYGEYK